jgi:predicted nucleic acid-binding protein
MTIGPDWVVLDTNIWIFGLRHQPEQPACAQVLQHLPRLHVKIPRQVMLELQANLRHEEMREFFRLLHRHPGQTDIRWEQVDLSRIRTYQRRGCKLGDAAVAAHLEVLGVGTLVSENRDFLYEIMGLPFRVLRAADFLRELGEVE